MNIVVIACPGCGEYASLDGKYRRPCLGRTIPHREANGFQPHCSACATAIAQWIKDQANRIERGMPLWAVE